MLTVGRADGRAGRLAELLRHRLEPDRKVYVEHSNEVWNPSFSTNAYITKRGIETGLSASDDEWTRNHEAWTRYHARRMRELRAIFRELQGRPRVFQLLRQRPKETRRSRLAAALARACPCPSGDPIRRVLRLSWGQLLARVP